MARTILPTFALVAVFLLPLAAAHGWYWQAQHGYSQSNLVIQDCDDDWGLEGNPAFDGHDLGAIYLKESDAGLLMLIGTVGGYAAGASGTRSIEVVFGTPGVDTTITLTTTDNTQFAASATNGVQPTITRQPNQWYYPPDSPSGDTGSDGPRFSIELLLPWNQLELQNGDKIRGSELSATSFIGPSKADYIPGGIYTGGIRTGDNCPGESPALPSYDRKYIRNEFPITQSSWTPPPGGGAGSPSNTPPVAAFTWSPTTPRARDVVTFTDVSTDAEGPIQSWAWSFGDGATSTQPSPAHTYESAGNYSVNLTVTDAGGLTHAATHVVTIGPPRAAPGPNFTYAPTQPRAGRVINFTDTSLPGSAAITTWGWSFGDGSSSTSRNLNHSYALAGTYLVRLTVTNADGLNATKETNLTVLARAELRANITIGTSFLRAGLPIELIDATSPGEHPLSAWRWTFGDGANATTRNATHAYSAEGNYTVTLLVTDASGATADASVNLTILPPETLPPPIPNFRWEPANATTNEPVRFTDASTPPQRATISSWLWSFGDGSTSSEPNPEHAFDAPGNYIVTLRVTASNGLGATEEHAIIVVAPNSAPIARIHGPRIAYEGQIVSFTSASEDPDADALTTTWILGGETREGERIERTYGKAGTYTITLSVTDTRGATAEIIHTLVIKPILAKIDFDILTTPTSIGETLALQDTSQLEGVNVVERTWSFGDGATAATTQADHAYDEPGTYEVQLRLRTSDGRAHVASRNVTIVPSPPTVTTAPPSPSPTPNVTADEARTVPGHGILAAVVALFGVAINRRRT